LSTDLRARIQAADPAAGLPAYDERCESMVSAILLDDGSGRHTQGRGRPSRRRVAVVAGVLVAACVGVFAAGI